jgi:hypothetical protein
MAYTDHQVILVSSEISEATVNYDGNKGTRTGLRLRASWKTFTRRPSRKRGKKIKMDLREIIYFSLSVRTQH